MGVVAIFFVLAIGGVQIRAVIKRLDAESVFANSAKCDEVIQRFDPSNNRIRIDKISNLNEIYISQIKGVDLSAADSYFLVYIEGLFPYTCLVLCKENRIIHYQWM